MASIVHMPSLKTGKAMINKCGSLNHKGITIKGGKIDKQLYNMIYSLQDYEVERNCNYVWIYLWGRFMKAVTLN